MKTILNFVVTAIVVLVLDYFMDDIHVTSFTYALIAAVLLGILNIILKPLLQVMTIPSSTLAFGFFNFILNIIVVLLISWLMKPNFNVDGFWAAVFFSFLLAIIQALLHIGDKAKG